MKLWQYIAAPFVLVALILRALWAKLTGEHYDPPDFG